MFTLLTNILKNLWNKPATRCYPFEKRPVPDHSRGHLDIEIEKCSFCGLCQKRCPANALTVSRNPKSWSVNHYACIICGYCLEGCPKKCLVMKKDHFQPG